MCENIYISKRLIIFCFQSVYIIYTYGTILNIYNNKSTKKGCSKTNGMENVGNISISFCLKIFLFVCGFFGGGGGYFFSGVRIFVPTHKCNEETRPTKYATNINTPVNVLCIVPNLN